MLPHGATSPPQLAPRARGFAFGQQAFALVGMVVVFMRQHPPEVEATQARERARELFADEHARGGSPPSSPRQAPTESSVGDIEMIAYK